MKQIIFLTFLLLTGFQNLTAQVSEANNKIIATYEGFPPVPFEAPDLAGEKHFLLDYKEKVVVLYFWNMKDEKAKEYLMMMNDLSAEFKSDDVVILSFADEDKATLEKFTQKAYIQFPIIPNAKGLAEMGYADKLGYPRAFVIDKFGIIQKLITSESENFYAELKESIKKYLEL
ncbi:MAG TPA: redoxin domain-containing protein [Saprospiraceae bacterium]|nr:redoxin domain-containing protein [Saprospiraceae bacterium]